MFDYGGNEPRKYIGMRFYTYVSRRSSSGLVESEVLTSVSMSGAKTVPIYVIYSNKSIQNEIPISYTKRMLYTSITQFKFKLNRSSFISCSSVVGFRFLVTFFATTVTVLE